MTAAPPKRKFEDLTEGDPPVETIVARPPPTSVDGDVVEEEIIERRTERKLERMALIEKREELRNLQLRQEIADMEAETYRRAAPADDDDPEAGAILAAQPAVHRARIRPRHAMVIASFLLVMILPTAVSGWYLWTRAYDRYASVAGFSVRTEEISSAFELLGGVAQLSGSSSSDTEILYQFIQSSEMVTKINARIDLRAVWAKADPAVDPIYAYHPPGTIEDMTDYWRRMVKVYSDSGSGLVDLEVQAFTPDDAQAIALAIYDESSQMINRLSAVAREDTTRYAKEELELSVERLKVAREAMTRFRNRTQIVDPAASIQSQMGILSSLQAQLAQTLVDLDLLRQSTRDNDPRITQTERRVEVIELRIAEERRKLGIGTGTGQETADDGAFADLVGEYERLLVDLDFAQVSYTAALAAHDSAQAEARRQTRYLAAHVSPTLAEAATFPQRPTVIVLVAIFSLLTWSVLVLVGYSIRDRR